MKYDFLIVGSGLFGSVCARELTDLGYKCLVIDKRNHIGGNCYTEKLENINVHLYGPHIFHTSNEKVWNYVNKYIKFNNYRHHSVADYKGELYSLPFNMFTFNKLFGVNTPHDAMSRIDEQRFTGVPSNLEEQALSQVGSEVYEKLIKGYTTKQWMKDPKELPPSIIKRIPVRFTFDNNYFFDKYQGIPENGYTQLFEKLLDGIEVQLNTDYFSNKDYFNQISEKIIYTGPIDKFFDYKFGDLEYRPLKFEHETLETQNFQGWSIINYTDIDVPYTRIVEHKHFENSNSEKTIITKEYPIEWTKESEPYYPINDSKNQEIFDRYLQESKKQEKVFFGGRLAEYKYYDMHQVIDSALKMVNKVRGVKNLTIHNPCNENTRYYRDYNLFWDDLTEELKKKYNITENRYYEGAHYSRMKVQLNKRTREHLELLECEYVIEDDDSGDFWILSVAEQITGGILTEQSNPHLKKVLYSQYIPSQIVHHTKNNAYKYEPWIFFPQDVVDLEFYYNKRNEKTDLIPKLFFKGNTEYRPIIEHINKEILSETNKLDNRSYFDILTDYKVCLSIGGVANGDLCYRDVECMAMGVPLLRFDFTTTLNPALIPNYHYISIPIPQDLPKQREVPKDRLGEARHAALIEKRFNEVVYDNDFLEFISKNARNYYNKYLSKESRVHHTIKLLEL